MIGPTSPFRLVKPNHIKSQSAPFISQRGRLPASPLPKAILALLDPSPRPSSPLITPPHLVGRPHLFGHVGTEGTAWQGQTRLSRLLAAHRSERDSPFLPRRMRGPGGGMAFVGPKVGKAEKTRTCKEAFMWRLAFAQHRGLLPSPRPSPPSPTPSAGPLPFQLPDRKPASTLAEGKVLEDGRFSWGGMTEDPVPRLVELLGGEMTLTPRERRWLGLPRRDPENEWGGEGGMKVSEVSRKVPPPPKKEEDGQAPKFVSRVDRLDRVPNFGRYRTLERPFKGRISERTLVDRRQKIADKMAEMPSKVDEYQQARREGRAKKRKELPF